MTTAKEALMHTNQALTLLLAMSIAACTSIDIDNKAPTAKAIATIDGKAVDPKMPASYTGQPVTLTLDGTKSRDSDGRITDFIWMRTDSSLQPDSGVGTAPTEGGPMNGATTTVTLLAAGDYQFSLWVRDDDGEVSAPSTVKLTLETPYMPDAACLGYYKQSNEPCQQCLCQPNAMGGCLDELGRCLANTDPAYTTLCAALVACSVAKGCKGTMCGPSGASIYTADTCMAEVDAAGAFTMGGNVGTCSMTAMADANPCAGASAITPCTMASPCKAICGF
jgi:hypothetical protein